MIPGIIHDVKHSGLDAAIFPGVSLTSTFRRASILMMNKIDNNQKAQPANPTAEAVLHYLGTRGYPITEQRRTLVGFIMSRSKMFTPDELLSDLKIEGIRIGRATVFRTLDLMERFGYLSRVPNGGHLSYATCQDGQSHHHHLVCSNCGQVLHFEGCPVRDLLAELQSRTGYQIMNHRLEIAGLCPSCQR